MLCSRIVLVGCLASLFIHGQKTDIHAKVVPLFQEETPGLAGTASQTAAPEGPTDKALTLLNFGTKEDLQNKMGVSPVEATNIIRKRPYKSLAGLRTKNAVSKKTFKQIKDRVKNAGGSEQ